MWFWLAATSYNSLHVCVATKLQKTPNERTWVLTTMPPHSRPWVGSSDTLWTGHQSTVGHTHTIQSHLPRSVWTAGGNWSPQRNPHRHEEKTLTQHRRLTMEP